MTDTSLRYKLHSGKNSKAGYYLQAGFRDLLPDAMFRRRLDKELAECARLYKDVDDRVDYYCKLTSPTPLDGTAAAIGSLNRKDSRSVYYYDSRELLQWFPEENRWCHRFGDVVDVMPCPTIVKSRPLDCDNSNNVLLKLNRCRHYIFLHDHKQFGDKKAMVLYRGHIGTRENRRLFCDTFTGNPRVDAADTTSDYGKQSEYTRPRLSLYEQLDFRYIMALEGNDVASNLKWIMSSHSLAVMPKPTCETWFMEGRLQAGVHYIEVKPDYSDLMEKMDYYDAHPKEAESIIHAANEYVDQFRNHRRERYIGLRVMQKYFNLTNV